MLAERAAKLVDALFVASCGRGAGVSDDGLFVGVGEAGSRGLGRGRKTPCSKSQRDEGYCFHGRDWKLKFAVLRPRVKRNHQKRHRQKSDFRRNVPPHSSFCKGESFASP